MNINPITPAGYYVPYTGATTTVNLGAQILTTTGTITSGPLTLDGANDRMMFDDTDGFTLIDDNVYPTSWKMSRFIDGANILAVLTPTSNDNAGNTNVGLGVVNYFLYLRDCSSADDNSGYLDVYGTWNGVGGQIGIRTEADTAGDGVGVITSGFSLTISTSVGSILLSPITAIVNFSVASTLEPLARTSNAAGYNLDVHGGDALAGTSSNKAGGTLSLRSGVSTGTGVGKINFWTAPAGSSGTGANAQTQKWTIDGAGSLLGGTDGTGTFPITTVAVITGTFFQTSTAPTANSSGTVAIVAKDANLLTANAGWMPFKTNAGTTVYIPYWA